MKRKLLLALLLTGFISTASHSFAAEDAKIDLKTLAVGSAFPDFSEKDLDGKPIYLIDKEGKLIASKLRGEALDEALAKIFGEK